VSFDGDGNPENRAQDVTITNPYLGVWCIKPDGVAPNAQEDAELVATPDYSMDGTGYDSGTGHTYLTHVEVRSSGKDCPAGTFEVLTGEVDLNTASITDVQSGFAFVISGWPGSTAAAPLGSSSISASSGRDGAEPITGIAATKKRPSSSRER
jgi:hypothetical protein